MVPNKGLLRLFAIFCASFCSIVSSDTNKTSFPKGEKMRRRGPPVREKDNSIPVILHEVERLGAAFQAHVIEIPGA